jgi:IclR family pca regulon transcriptional regulator
MGRVLLAALSEPELREYFASVQLQRFTERSIGSVDQLRAEIDSARAKGWSMVSQELEEGLRGVAVPVRRGHDVVAAVNVSLQTHRAPAETIEETVLPLLRDAALRIGNDYGGRHAGALQSGSRR